MGMMQMWKGGKGKAGGGGKGSSPKGGPGQKAQGPKIFVGGLPKVVSDFEIREFFSNFGDVVDVKMMYNDAMESKGFCFVTFATADSAQAVFDNYDNNRIG